MQEKNMLPVIAFDTFIPSVANPPVLTKAKDAFEIFRPAGSSPVHAAHVLLFDLEDVEAVQISVTGHTAGLSQEKSGVIFSFCGSDGKPVERGYLCKDGDFFQRKLRRPADSTTLRLELFSRWTDQTVQFSMPKVQPISAEPERKARIVAVKMNPVNGNNEQQLDEIEEKLQLAKETPDLILLPENHNTRGLPAKTCPYEPINGPFANRLAAMAVKFHSYVCATFSLLDEEKQFRNAAVLFDRNGELAGVYYKVHLTMSEAEKGFIPGEKFQVFELDFGKVAILTCWDNWFSESCRIVAGLGAELVLFPLAGDGEERHWKNIWPARAMDCGVTLAIAPAQGEAVEPVPAAIILPDGSWAASATENPGYAAATVVLNRAFQTYWLSVGPCRGEGRDLYFSERRPSAYCKDI